MGQTIVGLKDLRENIERYVEQVRRGKTLLVVRRSKPLFTISSPDGDNSALWETVIDFTKIKKDGVDIHDVLKSLRSLNG